MNQFQLPGRLIALTGHTLQAAGFAILLLDSVIAPEKSIYQFLNHRLVKHIGVLSYSIYIWQQIFCNPQLLGLNPQTWWMSFPGWLVPGVLVALLSYYGLEMPFFRLRKRYGSTQKEALKTGL
jgi:peptidoglycan/LPS O-acetylase OafA/YrhL